MKGLERLLLLDVGHRPRSPSLLMPLFRFASLIVLLKLQPNTVLVSHAPAHLLFFKAIKSVF